MNPQAPIPEFGAPPVSEVALGVEFLPLIGWRGPHAGRYWSEISNEYPNIEEVLPLPSQIEKFGEEFRRLQLAPRVQMMDPNATRSWFIGNPRNRLIQVQSDRFIVNWRKIAADDVYPRYEREMRPRFENEWGKFRKFVEQSGLGTINVQQCEVTYVNDIFKGDGWESFGEALELFSSWSGRGSGGFLPDPDMLQINGAFTMPEESGRLHFSIQRILQPPDFKEGVQLQLTARGKPASSNGSDLRAWMDKGREWVVRGFADLTTPKAHDLWRRTR